MMPSSNSFLDDTVPLKLLSLDGGGMRGLSILIIVKYLMKRIDSKNPPKPCDYFDLIAGTSTGGLIALMLGRLRMDIDTCINNYIQLSSAIFGRKKSRANIIGQSRRIWKVRGAYSAEGLASEFRDAARLIEGDENALLREANGSCKVFVCAFTKSLNAPVLLRSYETDDAVDQLSTQECKIWEAARATSAAATFFDPIKIGLQEYVDGATGYNNPVELVLEEARRIWKDAPSRVQCLVSIGTGVPNPKDFGNNLKEVFGTLKAISIETEKTEQRFLKNSASFGLGGRYFRFNVSKGLNGVGLDECDQKSLGRITAASESYLEDERVREMVEKFTLSQSQQHILVDANERDKYLRWLPYTDSSEVHNRTRRFRTTKTTGDWFLKDHSDIRKSQHGSFLWLNAKAGSGKTVLTSTLIDDIESQSLGVLAYFYFSFATESSQVRIDVFKYTLLTQIIKSLSERMSKEKGKFFIPKSFRAFYDHYAPSRNPKPEHTDEVFRAVLREADSIYIVVDALDECPSEKDQIEIVQFLASLAEAANSTRHKLHIIITSRPEENIETAMRMVTSSKKYIIPFDVDQVNNDIKNHLFECTQQGVFQRWDPALRTTVVDHLTNHADGVFRWADLQLKELEKKHRRNDIEKLLKALPKTLEETYERMLRRIEDIHHTEAVSILRWLMYSKRPLLLIEVNEIAAFDLSTETGPAEDDAEISFSPEDRFPNSSEIRNMLSGLITLSSLDESSSDEPWRMRITLAHFSVKEYLQSSSVNDCLPRFHLTPTSSHWFIFRSCLAYIQFYDECDEKATGAPYVLLRYACKFLWAHFEMLLSELDEFTKQRRIEKVDELKEGLCGVAFRLSNAVKDNIIISPDDFNHPRRLGTHGISPAKIDVGYPDDLQVAALLGDVNVVALLLDAGVDIEGQVPGQRTALHFAAAKGNLETVNELIKRGCNIDPINASGRTPLSEAAVAGHAEIVNALLQSGSDISKSTLSSEGKRRRLKKACLYTSLQIHILRSRCKTIAYRALDSSTKIGSLTNGFYPIHYAAKHGRDEIIDMLLLNGANIEQATFWGHNALSIAAAEGHAETVRMLIRRGAKISKTLGIGEDYSYNILHIAAANWHPQVVEVLLEENVNIHEKAIPCGSSALHLAVVGVARLAQNLSPYPVTHPWGGGDVDQQANTVEVLLNGGANIDQRDERNNTALRLAAFYGHDKAFEVLLKSDIDINVPDENGFTTLHDAACGGATKVVHMVLNAGAKLDPQSQPSLWTPLIMASGNGFVDVVQVLVEAGASLNAMDNEGRTALHAAAKGKHQKIYQLLLEKGADPDMKDIEGVTARMTQESGMDSDES